jgi:hypothetical protein
METINTGKTLEQMLESDRFEGICGLYSWSMNYDDFAPFRYFLDLIGHSAEMIGVNIGDWDNVDTKMGYMELDYLADALKEYANKGGDAYRFVLELLEAEAEGKVL